VQKIAQRLITSSYHCLTKKPQFCYFIMCPYIFVEYSYVNLRVGEKDKRNKCIGSEGEEKEERSNLHPVKVANQCLQFLD
jgi:hypothetical protein